MLTYIPSKFWQVSLKCNNYYQVQVIYQKRSSYGDDTITTIDSFQLNFPARYIPNSRCSNSMDHIPQWTLSLLDTLSLNSASSRNHFFILNILVLPSTREVSKLCSWSTLYDEIPPSRSSFPGYRYWCTFWYVMLAYCKVGAITQYFLTSCSSLTADSCNIIWLYSFFCCIGLNSLSESET